MEIYTCARIKAIIALKLYLAFFFVSCSHDEPKIESDKYYIEGAISNGSPLYFRAYKMWALTNAPEFKYPGGTYFHQSDEITEPIRLLLINQSAHKTYDTTLFNPYSYYPFPKLKGKTGNSYSLQISIGNDSITSFFKIPDSFLVDTYSLSTEIDNEYLHFNIKLPPSYLKDSIVFHEPKYRYAGDIFWDFCKTEYPISAKDVIDFGYLNWYNYIDCQLRNWYDSRDNAYRIYRMMLYFEPNNGQPVSALPINDYRYLRKLNEHVYKGLNGITQPVAFPSKFNSTVFYGGVIGYTSQLVKFKEP